MSDRGPEIAKERIQATLGRFLEGSSVTELATVEDDSQRFDNDVQLLPLTKTTEQSAIGRRPAGI